MSNTHFRGGHDYGVRHCHASHSAPLEALVASVLTEEGLAPELPARALVLLGSVYVENERLQNPEALIRAGSLLRVHARPRRYPHVSDIGARIIRETPTFIIVDKPAGLPVHAMVDNAKENLLSYLETALSRPLYITHRLDIETSGVILIALSPTAQTMLNKQLAAKQIKRFYFAFTQTPVAPGTYTHFMDESPKAPKIVHDNDGDKRLRCELTVMSCAEIPRDQFERRWQIDSLSEAPIYQLAIELGTGRTQQIRAQLAHLQAPIIGDHAYNNLSYLLDRLTLRRAIGLRAESLTFA